MCGVYECAAVTGAVHEVGGAGTWRGSSGGVVVVVHLWLGRCGQMEGRVGNL